MPRSHVVQDRCLVSGDLQIGANPVLCRSIIILTLRAGLMGLLIILPSDCCQFRNNFVSFGMRKKERKKKFFFDTIKFQYCLMAS